MVFVHKVKIIIFSLSSYIVVFMVYIKLLLFEGVYPLSAN